MDDAMMIDDEVASPAGGVRWSWRGAVMLAAAVAAAANLAGKVPATASVAMVAVAAAAVAGMVLVDRRLVADADPPLPANHTEMAAAGVVAGVVAGATVASGVGALVWASGWAAGLALVGVYVAGRGGPLLRRVVIAGGGFAALWVPTGELWTLPVAAATVVALARLAQPESTSAWRDEVILAVASVCPPADVDEVQDRRTGQVTRLSRTATISRRLQVSGAGGWVYTADRYPADPVKVQVMLEGMLPQFEASVQGREVRLELVTSRRLLERQVASATGGVVEGVGDMPDEVLADVLGGSPALSPWPAPAVAERPVTDTVAGDGVMSSDGEAQVESLDWEGWTDVDK